MLATLLAGCRGCQGTGGGLDDSGTGGTPGGDIPQVDAEALDAATAAIFAGSRWEDDVVGLGAVLQDLVNETAAVAPTTAEGLSALLNEMMIPIYAGLVPLFDGQERTDEELSAAIVAMGDSLEGVDGRMMEHLAAATAEAEGLVGDLSAVELDLSEELADVRTVEVELREEIHAAGMSGELVPNVLLSALGKVTRITHDPDFGAVSSELSEAVAALEAMGPPPPFDINVCIDLAVTASNVNVANLMSVAFGILLGIIGIGLGIAAVPLLAAYAYLIFLVLCLLLTLWLIAALRAENAAFEAALDSCYEQWDPFISPSR